MSAQLNQIQNTLQSLSAETKGLGDLHKPETLYIVDHHSDHPCPLSPMHQCIQQNENRKERNKLRETLKVQVSQADQQWKDFHHAKQQAENQLAAATNLLKEVTAKLNMLINEETAEMANILSNLDNEENANNHDFVPLMEEEAHHYDISEQLHYVHNGDFTYTHG